MMAGGVHKCVSCDGLAFSLPSMSKVSLYLRMQTEMRFAMSTMDVVCVCVSLFVGLPSSPAFAVFRIH